MRTWTYIVPDDMNTVREKIAAETEPLAFRMPFQKHKIFCGEVEENRFRLILADVPRTIFPLLFPVAYGTMDTDSGRTMISVNVRPVPLMHLMNWLGVTGCCCVVVSIVFNLWKLSFEPLRDLVVLCVFGVLCIPFLVFMERRAWNNVVDHYEGGFEQIFQLRTRPAG